MKTVLANLPDPLIRQAVAQTDVAIVITDLQARMLYANAAFLRTTGYVSSEVVGHKVSLISSQTTPPAVYRVMWTELAAGRPWSGRLLNRRKEGSLYLAELTITPVFDEHEVITHFIGMQRDITAIYRMECQLRNQKHLIETVLDAAPMVFALLDLSGRVLLDNQEYKKLISDLGEAEPACLMLDHALPGWREWLATEPERCAFATREVRLERHGATRWFSCSATLIRQQDELADNFFCGRVTSGLLLCGSEITAMRVGQERAQAAALQALLAEEERILSMREGLSAILTRLEEPLNVLDSALRLLERRDPESAALLQPIIASGRAQLSALYSVIPQEGSGIPVSLNLNELLREVLQVATPGLLASGITVDWLPAAELPALTGRALPLRLLFKALIDNAIEAMHGHRGGGRELEVSTCLAGDCLQVRIADRGPGLGQEGGVNAFTPFYTTKSNRHFGTGLSRAQHIASEHDAFIDLHDRPGGGCIATVEFRLGRQMDPAEKNR